MHSDAGTCTREEVVAKARELVGKNPLTKKPMVRFLHQGRNPRWGLDCAGVLFWVGHQLELTDYEFSAYVQYPDGKTLERIFMEQLSQKSWEDAKIGDILLLRSVDRGWPCHMGILSDNRLGYRGFGIIHSWARVDGVVESRLDEDWAMRKTRSIWGWPRMEDADG